MRKTKVMYCFRLSSVPLLSLLGAGVLLCHGAHLVSASQQNTPKSGKPTAAQTGQSKPAPQTKAQRPKSQIGDVTISDFISADGTLSKFHWAGPNTEIVVPDKTSNSVLTVHANDVEASRAGQANFSLLVLSGNVRYHLVQKTDKGERILDGTAGRAVLRRTTQQLEFTGGVHANLTDPARFSGPATLRTGSLNVSMDIKPSRYNLAGDAANNDIQFTPLQTHAAKADPKPGALKPKADTKPEAPTPAGTVHLFGFHTAELQFGKSIHLQGAGTTGDFASLDKKTAWHLVGDAFEGEFEPDQSDLQRATVTDNVQFHILQPASDKKTETTTDGTASSASYLRTPTAQETVVHWPFKVTYANPLQLAKPGHLTGGEGATLTLKESEDGFWYHLEDPNGTGHIDFTPKATEANTPKPVVPPVPK